MEKVAPIFRPWQAVRKCVRVDSVLTSTRNTRNTGKSGSFEKSCFVCGWLHEAEDLLAAGVCMYVCCELAARLSVKVD